MMIAQDRNVPVAMALRPEATCTTRFLPGCRACGSRHPLAIDPAADPRFCLSCGAVMPDLDEAQTSPAVLTGSRAALGRALMTIGRWFARLSK